MSRGPGRPALVRNVYSFERLGSAVPSELVLDTSCVVKALVETEAQHFACQSFMLDMVNAETVVYFSRLLEIELAEVAFKLAVIEQHGKKAWPAKRADGRVRRRAARLSTALFRSWTDLLDSVPHLRIELHEVASSVPGLMAAHGLASIDAVHVATAAYVQADGLVTTDAGFGCVPAKDLVLFVDESRVRSCRRRRGGR